MPSVNVRSSYIFHRHILSYFKVDGYLLWPYPSTDAMATTHISVYHKTRSTAIFSSMNNQWKALKKQTARCWWCHLSIKRGFLKRDTPFIISDLHYSPVKAVRSVYRRIAVFDKHESLFFAPATHCIEFCERVGFYGWHFVLWPSHIEFYYQPPHLGLILIFKLKIQALCRDFRYVWSHPNMCPHVAFN